MFENIRCDAARYNLHRHTGFRFFFQRLSWWLTEYGLQAVIVYRYGQWVKGSYTHPVFLPLRLCLLLVYKLLAGAIRKLYGIYLSSGAEIGPGLKIGHFGGVYVGPGSSLGSNCSIQQHVRIGSNVQVGNERGNQGGPKIGSRVWIGAHSKVLGNITVADRATIAAGSIVENDVGAQCLMLGSPARVINKDYDNSEILDTKF